MAMISVLSFVAFLAGAAPGPVKSCALLAPGARPVIEVAAQKNHAALAVYLLGFSKQGRLAWLERRVGFDGDEYVWLMYVLDLNSDRTVAEREFLTKTSDVDSMCTRHGAAIARVLRKQEIERGPELVLEQPDAARDPTGVDFVVGRRDREADKTPYRVILRGKNGVKQLGVMWRVEVDSGESPLGEPKLAGILRSPYEARVAVLARQTMIGTEGVEITMVKVLGGRLDKGWRTEP